MAETQINIIFLLTTKNDHYIHIQHSFELAHFE